MSWLHSIDLAVFRFINLKLSNPVLDFLMARLSGNAWFLPAVLVLAGVLVWRGGARARLLVLSLALLVGAGDAFLINTIKKAAARPRPFLEVPEANVLVGRGQHGSMPSSHTSTLFAVTIIAAAYYRRSWRLLLPLAVLMGFSRIYLGVHYPSDVLIGALLGAGYAGAGLWLLSRLWTYVGARWFPVWFMQLPAWIPATPSRKTPPQAGGEGVPAAEEAAARASQFKVNETDLATLRERQWLRLGYILVALLFVCRIAYLASNEIELSEDEAYQWVWSKHLALSYYSKPPMIALLHYFGTALWGDTALGVRFCPPLVSALLGLLLLRFFARYANGRLAFFMVLVANTTPLLAAGSILMTIDPPLVLFWCAAMCAGWRALQNATALAPWLWMGVWMGLGFLSKYSALFFLPSFALFFVLWPPAREHLRRPGLWLALVPLALATVPVLVWNAQHDWVTVQHVSENAQLAKPWRPTLVYFLEFTAAEAGLLNPIYFVAMLAAAGCFWVRARERPLELYLFAMGAPVFFGYWLYTLHSRVHPNWIAPAVVPLLGLTLLYWERRWRGGSAHVVRWLTTGVLLGGVLVIVCHDTSLLRLVARINLPARLDPLRRVRGISEIARVAGDERRALQEGDRKETFILASHYGLTGQITFYLPEARLGLPGSPLVYPRSTRGPKNQFYFWPEYRYRETRKGQNAVYIRFSDKPEPPPQDLLDEFQSVTDLGYREIKVGNQVFHRVQIFACRHVL